MDQIEKRFFVDQDGVVCTTAVAPEGMHYEFEEKPTYRNVLLVVTATGEVDNEYVLWDSLEALSTAGVDVSRFTNAQRIN